MKRVLMFLFLILIAVTGFSQVVDSTLTLTYNYGESFKSFLGNNVWTIIAFALFFLSEWIGNNSKIKENSVFKFVFKFISGLVAKKANKAKNVKAKVLLMLMILGAGSICFAQDTKESKWKGFFKPVPAPEMTVGLTASYKAAPIPEKTYIRLTAAVQAVQFTYNKDLKKIEQNAFNKVGVGLSYAHFIAVNGEYFNNWSVNGFVFAPTEAGTSSFSIAGTVSALQYINAGIGYDFGLKQAYILTGLSYTF